ncbi:restriction endonuclease subunit S [Desulfobacula toluolica]|uniref:Putative restriction modification system, type I n=1 Tax=Desulfobacula toluolica (strain DSM 7467 / Tol2) TaxID=651182 RepID=K0NCG2_DESTT|nr:restriction endonuclease subunit S [Desulfobacula toluolica]CCK78350.1 putative restriction modification system, type I [Desulfobacula toluolica Tol2]
MKVFNLGDITNNLDSKRIPLNSKDRAKKSKQKLYPYIGANNVLEYIDEYIFNEKILCIAEDGGSWGRNQICAKIYNEKCWVNNHAHVLTNKNNVVLEYLCAYLNYANLNPYITGTTRGKLTRKNLDSIQIPLPPLNDQIRIAHLLGKVEALIARRKHHLQQLDELLRSVFLEMFGDPLENPKGFPIKKLSDFYVNFKEGTKCGPFGSVLKKDEFVDVGIAVWNMDNIDPAGRMVHPFRMWITEEKYQKLRAYSVLDGDIIISRAGTVGKMCVAKMDGEPAIISTNLIRLRLGDKLRPLHIVSLITYCKGRVSRLKTGPDGGFTHMNTGILNNFEFPYPPIGLQDKFATIVEKVEGIKIQYQQSLTDLEKLYGALSQKAFKGELDLSRVPMPVEPDEADKELIETEPESVLPEHKKHFEFSTPDQNQRMALSSTEGRKPVLQNWLDEYLQWSGKDAAFSIETFMKEAQHKLDELDHEAMLSEQGAEGAEPVLGIKDYDHLKEWIFDQIRSNRIEQTRNAIKMDDREELDNTIILKNA